MLGVYIGASYAKAHADDTEIYTTNNAGGFLFGLRSGVLYEIDSHSQIELGFKSSKNNDKRC
ncbi:MULTISPECIES: hypothetical protein [unclassified Campylobacter]|uniref:hypothetical protein n=1 Tax=unclassified Campylobacter TaxID=2593542 RepID=UPI003D324F0D